MEEFYQAKIKELKEQLLSKEDVIVKFHE